MPDCDIRNVAKRADLVIEYITPSESNFISSTVEQCPDPLLKLNFELSSFGVAHGNRSNHIWSPVPRYSGICEAMPYTNSCQVSGARRFVILFGEGLSHGHAVEFDVVSVVDDAIEGCVFSSSPVIMDLTAPEIEAAVRFLATPWLAGGAAGDVTCRRCEPMFVGPPWRSSVAWHPSVPRASCVTQCRRKLSPLCGLEQPAQRVATKQGDRGEYPAQR